MTRWHFLGVWGGLFIVALSSGVDILFYASYMLLFLGGATYVWTRWGVRALVVRREATQGYVHLGDDLELSYTLENRSRLGKLWLEVFEESNWPEPLLGRVLSVGPNGTKRWRVEVPAVRRGRYRLGPIVLRTGDPFGILSAEKRVRSDAVVLVYPRIVQLPHWDLPGSFLEGSVLTGRRSLQATSMVMGIREYRPGDAFNRIHWKSTARHRSLHVKEFELDKTADLWIYLDLDRRWHQGEGDRSTEERAVTVVASVVSKALREHRNVGMITSHHRLDVLQPDRGTKQYGKLMQYLADVTATGGRGLAETVIETLPRLDRGASAIVVTPSLDRGWVRPLHTLREGGVVAQAVVVTGERLDDRDRARLAAISGELRIAGIPCGVLGPDEPLETLFRGGASVSASA